jgi:hypothetical protein
MAPQFHGQGKWSTPKPVALWAWLIYYDSKSHLESRLNEAENPLVVSGNLFRGLDALPGGGR